MVRSLAALSIAVAAVSATAQPSPELAEAEVRRVDKAARKLTLKHGEIKNLDMPPMTMVFDVSKPEMLDQVKAGDRIRFRAVSQGGAFTVTEIQPVK